jgi:ABC-type sugar transport system permease subunit
VTLPIAMFFSYFVFKKIWGSTFYKVIFFIPSILPLFILTMVYKYSLNQGGLISGHPRLDARQRLRLASSRISSSSIIRKKWMVWLFCVWAGIGYDVILLTAGMSGFQETSSSPARWMASTLQRILPDHHPAHLADHHHRSSSSA